MFKYYFSYLVDGNDEWKDDHMVADNWEAAKAGIQALVKDNSWVVTSIHAHDDSEIWNLRT